MTTVRVFNAERMQEIEDNSIVSGSVISDHLILQKHDGSMVDAGVVVGADGSSGSIKRVVVASSEANANSIATADFVCDGVDDQEQFLAAYEALNGDETWGPAGEIFLTEGTFYLNLSELVEMYYVKITGCGKDNTYLEVTHPTDTAFQLSACTLTDLNIFDTTTGGENQTLLLLVHENIIDHCEIACGDDNTAVHTEWSDNLFRNCYFYCSATGIGVNVRTGGVFENCSFSSTGGEAVRVYSPENTAYSSYQSIFRGCKFAGLGDHCLKFYGNATASNPGAFCLIDGCTFDCVNADYGIHAESGDYDDLSHLTITGCTFQNINKDKTAISIDGLSGIKIEGNRFIGFLKGIDLLNSIAPKINGNQFHGTIDHVVLNTCERVAIENNMFHGFISPSDVLSPAAGQQAIDATSCGELFIEGNQFVQIATHVVTLTTCDFGFIEGNQLFRCGQHTDNTYTGIKLVTSDDVSILNNRASQFAADTVKLKYCVEIGSGCDRTYVRGNHFYAAFDTAAIQDGGTSTDTTSANKIS